MVQHCGMFSQAVSFINLIVFNYHCCAKNSEDFGKFLVD